MFFYDYTAKSSIERTEDVREGFPHNNEMKLLFFYSSNIDRFCLENIKMFSCSPFGELKEASNQPDHLLSVGVRPKSLPLCVLLSARFRDANTLSAAFENIWVIISEG